MTLNSGISSFLTDPVPRPLALEEIDGEDDLYRMSYGFDPDPLRVSIRFSGLIHPLILQERPGRGPRILSGFRRYCACRDLGIRTVPTLTASGAPEALYQAVLLENLSHRSFNPVEISLALNRLRGRVPTEQIVGDWLPRMGLAPSGKLFSMHLAVWDLEEEIREALITGTLNIGDVPALLKWPTEERTTVFRLFRDLKAGTNLRREIALNLFEIGKRDGTPPSAFLAGPEVSAVIRDPDLSVPQKAQAVRWIVRKGRFPTLTSMEETFSGNIKALRLPPDISIQHPPFFEGAEYKCTFTFRDGVEFEACVRRIQGIGHEKILP